MKTKNSVEQAVQKVGGVTQASFLLKVNPGSIYRWQKMSYIPRYEKAAVLAKAAGVKLETLRPLEAIEEAA